VALLEVKNIHTYYGESYVLQGVSLCVEEHQCVALLGRNGMGKTTTIRSIMGLTPPRRGEIYFRGKQIVGMPTHQISQMGLGLVSQGRHIFPSLSVKENLLVAARKAGNSDPWSLERVYDFFPVLKERANNGGTTLSGGEQQMLAIGRTLMTNPDLILMDEPSEGLAPKIVAEVGRIIRLLRESGLSIILVEQNQNLALSVADRVNLINNGRIAAAADAEECRATGLLGKYLCV
jgi:branched-chain amino acid transport system ATP-binding protein